jgi:hypothetical protein
MDQPARESPILDANPHQWCDANQARREREPPGNPADHRFQEKDTQQTKPRLHLEVIAHRLRQEVYSRESEKSDPTEPIATTRIARKQPASPIFDSKQGPTHEGIQCEKSNADRKDALSVNHGSSILFACRA